MTDPIHNPAHYTQGSIEAIEAIRAALSPEEYRGFLRGQMIKYVWRAPHKGEYEKDVEKARWYAARLAEALVE